MSGLTQQPTSALVTNDPTEAAPSETMPTTTELVNDIQKPAEEAKQDRVTAVMVLSAVAIFWLMW